MESSLAEEGTVLVPRQTSPASNHLIEQDVEEGVDDSAKPEARPRAPPTRSRNARKLRKQQQVRRAMRAMMTSFQAIFEDSDADISDLDENDNVRSPERELVVGQYSTQTSDDESDGGERTLRSRRPPPPVRRRTEDSPYSSPLGRPRREYIYGESPETYPLPPRPPPPNQYFPPNPRGAWVDHDTEPIIIDPEPGQLSRRSTVLEEVNPGPIAFETALYEYKRAPDNEYDEPVIVDRTTTLAPRKVSKVGAKSDFGGRDGRRYVFKVVSMYSVPSGSKGHHAINYPRRPVYTRRDSFDSDRDAWNTRGRHYRSGRPARPVSVNGSLGTYLVIYSEVIIQAIRSCVKVYPGLARAFDVMCIPAPYTMIVHHRDELQAYSDAIAEESKTKPEEPQSPEVGQHDPEHHDDFEPDSRMPAVHLEPREHIPLLLNHVFTPEFTATYDHEMSLRKKAVPTCTYGLAWLLFRPGSMVYAWSGNNLDAYVVDWYELEGLYNTQGTGRRRKGLADMVRPPTSSRGEIPEFSPIPTSLVIRLHYIEFDGSRIGRRPKLITITPFEGEREISSLPAYPIEFSQDPKLKDNLIARGQKYVKLCQRHYMSYQGETISTGATPSRKINGRVMIDSGTYFNDAESVERLIRLKVPTEDGIIQSQSSSASDSSTFSDSRYRNRRKRRTYRRRIRDAKKAVARSKGMAEYDLVEPSTMTLKPEHYMLFPVQIWGFVLRERRWYLLHIDGLKDPVFQENIINDLVLKDEAKNLIEALSSTHSSHTDGGPGNDESEGFNHWSADIVQSKGEGRIFLLHGKPGVGKTSTAECVAEASQIPLLAITCGDLGIEPNEVERALMKWFKLATLWKAVLLLDEADVYLESRMSGDLARNSLVSIFLRALEYYQGVLFLTTNRVGTFDEAMLSRIHVVLHYADFEDTERQKIWTTSFRKLGEERPDVKVGPGVMDYALENQRVLDLKWNGREIRNAFNTVVALAEFDAEKKRRLGRSSVQVVVERSHLVQVVKMSEEFKKYMKSTRGLDESALAKALKIRDDAAMQTMKGLVSN